MLRFSRRRMTAAFATQLALQASTKQLHPLLEASAIKVPEEMSDYCTS
jgi:hypothetical protein